MGFDILPTVGWAGGLLILLLGGVALIAVTVFAALVRQAKQDVEEDEADLSRDDPQDLV